MGKAKESVTKKRAAKNPAKKLKVALSEKPVADPKPAAPELKAKSESKAKTKPRAKAKPKSKSKPKSPPGTRTPGTRTPGTRKRYKPELTLVRKVIKRFKDNLQEDTVTPSVGDLIRLLQMKKEMEGESPREIKIAWVDPESTKSSEE